MCVCVCVYNIDLELLKTMQFKLGYFEISFMDYSLHKISRAETDFPRLLQSGQIRGGKAYFR